MNKRPGPFSDVLACHRAGRYREAEALLLESLARQPRQPDTWNLMGATLAGLRRYPDAENAYRRALALQPDHLGALNNLAVLLRQTGRAEEARRTYLETLRHEPRHVDAWNNLAALHAARQEYDQALTCYRKVLELQPDYGHALGAAANAMAMLWEWSGRASICQRLADGIRAGASVTVPFVVLSHLDEPELQLAGARAWARRFDAVAMGPLPVWQHDRLRVAYLSADLREHPVGLQIAELIERHDRRQFEWFGVYFGPRVPGDATHRRLRLAFDSFLDIARLSDEEAARRLRALEIDILVDLGGHTLDGRPGLVARRPAPIQVNWLGYPGTSGASWIDYIVADRFLVPPESRSGYSERIVYLPDCFWVSDSQRPAAGRVPERVELGLPAEGFVFCCFSHSYKLNPAMFAVWMRLLRQVAGSVLWLLAAKPDAEERLRREADRCGVDPTRLVFAPRIDLAAHLARHAQADLFLDTLPFNAITTTSVALHAGLPVLSCAGRSFAARGAGSLLQAVGMSALVTGNLSDYEARALELATHPERLASLRRALAERLQTGPLFDAERFRRHLEAAYRAMWTRWQGGEAPADIVVRAAGTATAA